MLLYLTFKNIEIPLWFYFVIGLVILFYCINVRYKLFTFKEGHFVIYAAIIAGLLFIIDLSVPLGVAIGVIYIILIFSGWNRENPKIFLNLALCASTLTLLGYIFSPNTDVLWKAGVNRLLTIIAIWIVAILLYKIKRGKKHLELALVRLDARINLLKIKNKQLQQFTFIASHDLQEPVRTINTLIGMINVEVTNDKDNKYDKLKDYLNHINVAADRLDELMHALMKYSKIGNKKTIEAIDCNTVVIEVKKKLESSIKKSGATINVIELPVIRGYKEEIEELFYQIISNGIKFRSTDQSPVISIDSTQINGYWLFEIRDNGIGVDQEHTEQVFEIFKTLHAKEEFRGVGIGLATCKKIAEIHHGKIWMRSTRGNGTIVYFKLYDKLDEVLSTN